MAKFEILNHVDALECPLCGKAMTAGGSQSIVCLNKHNFDISKRGHVNFLSKPVKADYGKEMFKSRSIICESGFFTPMIQHITSALLGELDSKKPKPYKVLDAGCGEGSHLTQIILAINARSSRRATGFGIDISKEGIKLASKQSLNLVWCVADLAKLPFKDRQFHAILSIFSPSNYEEFRRVLAEDGLVIKVVPESEYLKELRRWFYKDTDKETYSNWKVVELFKDNFRLVEHKRLTYCKPIGDDDLKHLIKMTPLSWGVPKDKLDSDIAKEIQSITVDLSIMIGKK